MGYFCRLASFADPTTFHFIVTPLESSTRQLPFGKYIMNLIKLQMWQSANLSMSLPSNDANSNTMATFL